MLGTASYSLLCNNHEEVEDTSIEKCITLVNFLATHHLSFPFSLNPQSVDIMGLPALVLDTLYTIEVSQGNRRG